MRISRNIGEKKERRLVAMELHFAFAKREIRDTEILVARCANMRSNREPMR